MSILYNKTRPDTEREIIKDYHDGRGTNWLAIKYKKHRSTVQAILLRNNISLRKQSNTYYHNQNFFSEYNEQSCYWAGFILADGFIREKENTLCIKLHVSDEQHLQKFKKALSFEGNINKYTGKNYKGGYCTIDIVSKKIVKDIRDNFDITPRKSMTAKLSKKIPDNMLDHFIRGVMDGDGSVQIIERNVNNNKYMHVSFTGTKSVITSIRKILKLKTGCNQPNIQVPHRKDGNLITSSIMYYCKNAESILEWLYKRSDESLRLERKYMLWQNKPSTKHRTLSRSMVMNSEENAKELLDLAKKMTADGDLANLTKFHELWDSLTLEDQAEFSEKLLEIFGYGNNYIYPKQVLPALTEEEKAARDKKWLEELEKRRAEHRVNEAETKAYIASLTPEVRKAKYDKWINSLSTFQSDTRWPEKKALFKKWWRSNDHLFYIKALNPYTYSRLWNRIKWRYEAYMTRRKINKLTDEALKEKS